MARVGLDDLLRRLNAPDALRASYFAEIDNRLATAVERSWDRWAQAGGAPPAPPEGGIGCVGSAAQRRPSDQDDPPGCTARSPPARCRGVPLPGANVRWPPWG
eukprot:3400941-Lingulodinium_polyedra.AAC.1